MKAALIRECFAAVRPHMEVVMDHFFCELFERHPEAREFFELPLIYRQRMAIANGFQHVVEFLEETDHLGDYLRKMGVRHQRSGLRVEQYSWFKESLLRTFEFFLDSQWTPEVSGSWTELCDQISSQMKVGFLQAEAQGQPASKSASSSVSSANASSLDTETVREMVRSALIQVLDQELEGDFGRMIREKVRGLALQALEFEGGRAPSEVTLTPQGKA